MAAWWIHEVAQDPQHPLYVYLMAMMSSCEPQHLQFRFLLVDAVMSRRYADPGDEDPGTTSYFGTWLQERLE